MASLGLISPPWIGSLTEEQLAQLVEDTIAEIGVASDSEDGLFSKEDFTKLSGMDEADYVKFVTIGSSKYIQVPVAPDPSSTGVDGVLYVNSVTGVITAMKGSGGNARTGLAPVPNSIWSEIASDQTITGTNEIDLGVFAMLPNTKYKIDGDLGYNCDAAVDFEIFFDSIPASGSVTYLSFIGATVGTANAGQAAVSIDVTRKTGLQTLTLGGTGADEQGKISATVKIGDPPGGFVRLRGRKKNSGAAGNVTVKPSTLLATATAA